MILIINIYYLINGLLVFHHPYLYMLIQYVPAFQLLVPFFFLCPNSILVFYLKALLFSLYFLFLIIQMLISCFLNLYFNFLNSFHFVIIILFFNFLQILIFQVPK